MVGRWGKRSACGEVRAAGGKCPPRHMTRSDRTLISIRIRLAAMHVMSVGLLGCHGRLPRFLQCFMASSHACRLPMRRPTPRLRSFHWEFGKKMMRLRPPAVRKVTPSPHALCSTTPGRLRKLQRSPQAIARAWCHPQLCL